MLTNLTSFKTNPRTKTMTNTTNLKTQKHVKMPVMIEPLISILHNIQLKIDAAAGAATALELRLRIIAQLDVSIREELKNQQKLRKKRPKDFHQADLEDLIAAVIEIYKNKIDDDERRIIESCRLPRNKAAHASFAELMIQLTGEAPGRQLDHRTLKPMPLDEDDIIEGAVCIERNRGLDEFSKRARIAVSILEEKVMRSIKP